jgi:hypothetical protein
MLTSRDVETLQNKPKLDRFTVVGAHNQDYAIVIANSRTRKQTDRLTDETLIRIRIYDMAARMWVC